MRNNTCTPALTGLKQELLTYCGDFVHRRTLPTGTIQHEAYDFAGEVGAPVYAMHAGTYVARKDDYERPMVIVGGRHGGERLWSYYVHVRPAYEGVRDVERGDVIAHIDDPRKWAPEWAPEVKGYEPHVHVSARWADREWEVFDFWTMLPHGSGELGYPVDTGRLAPE